MLKILLLGLVTVVAAESYSERLNIYQNTMNSYLLDFQFNYSTARPDPKKLVQHVSTFPLPLLAFARNHPEVTSFEFNLVQGRGTLIEAHLPGFRLSFPKSIDKAAVSPITALVSELFSVATFELRNQNTLDLDDIYYFAKPYEAFCKENLQFLFRHWGNTNAQTGLTTLIFDQDIHNTKYRELAFKYTNKDSEVKVEIHFKHLQEIKKRAVNLSQVFTRPEFEIKKCLVCSSSSIVYNNQKVLYDMHEAGASFPLKQALFGQAAAVFEPEIYLESERYLADRHFEKYGTFKHRLSNLHDSQTIVAKVREYFPPYLHPYFHSLKVQVKQNNKYTELKNLEKVEFLDDGATLLKVDVKIPPKSEVYLTVEIRKVMMQFEQYTNDPARGFNIHQMPIVYHFESAPLQVRKIESAALLVQIVEPDFSMPFNVNSVTNAVWGFIVVNALNTLVKPKRFLR